MGVSSTTLVAHHHLVELCGFLPKDLIMVRFTTFTHHMFQSFVVWVLPSHRGVHTPFLDKLTCHISGMYIPFYRRSLLIPCSKYFIPTHCCLINHFGCLYGTVFNIWTLVWSWIAVVNFWVSIRYSVTLLFQSVPGGEPRGSLGTLRTPHLPSVWNPSVLLHWKGGEKWLAGTYQN